MRSLVLFLLLGLQGPAAAAELSLPIGSVQFVLGMPRGEVVEQARRSFHVVPVAGGATETYFLSESKPPKVDVIGGIAFKNDRLTWIQRSWGNFAGRKQANEATKALFSAIESATAATGSTAVVSSVNHRTPGVEFRTLHFDFPGRRVTVINSDGKDTGHSVGVTEAISEP
jgi:hypothetical protein